MENTYVIYNGMVMKYEEYIELKRQEIEEHR